MSDDVLRQMAREALQSGKLPDRTPDRMWGGAGSGSECPICGTPVGLTEFGVELQFGSDSSTGPGNHLVHLPCFSAFTSERKEPRPAGEAISDGEQQSARRLYG